MMMMIIKETHAVLQARGEMILKRGKSYSFCDQTLS